VKVLLALPPDVHRCEVYRVIGMNAPPLGLAYIAAILEAHGHKVSIIDSPTLKVDTKTFIHKVKEFKPDVIGLSIQTPLAPKAYNIAKVIKKESKDIIIIAGGPHPTYMYEEALNNGIDIVVRGEGEITTAELLDVLEKYGLSRDKLRKVQGIAFKDRDNRVIVTPPRRLITDLDSLPPPARHLLPVEKYTLFNKPIKAIHVMASRGCPYGCIFCITSYFWGRKVRFRSARKVVDEIEGHVYRQGARYVIFTDDELVMNRKFIYEFIKEVKERKLDIVFTCGARVDHVDKDYLKYLYDNGCIMLYFGVESGSQDTLDKIGKGITIDQSIRVFKWIKELKGHATASFILGFPWETVEDLEKTINFAIKLDPSYAQFTVATPYPGTPLYYFAIKNNLIVHRNWEHYTTLTPVMKGFYLDINTIKRYLKQAYRKFYLRWKFIMQELKSHKIIDIMTILLKESLAMISEKLREII